MKGLRFPRLALVAAIVASAALPARDARARVLDPDAAEADTRALIQAKDYSFCTKPADPLSPAARELCPLAGEAPGCTELVEACAKEDEPFRLGPFWERLAKLLGRVAPYVAWGLIAVLVAVVGWLVLRAVRAERERPAPLLDAKRRDVTALDEAPGAAPLTAAEALLQLAAAARARGDARDALFLYLAAALRALDDRGAIRMARDRTNGEYVRACQEAAARPPLRDLVREVDCVQFGGQEATLEAATLAGVRAERIVRPAPSHLAALAPLSLLTLALCVVSAVALSGCGGLDALSRDDPAGRGLLVDLLEKQGATVSSLPGSLAHLPMEGPRGAVMVLDAERVPLEDETRSHLVAWVRQGGALVIAGDPSRWPSELWAKRDSDEPACPPHGQAAPVGPTVKLRVETRGRPPLLGDDDDEEDLAGYAPAPVQVRHATLARRAAMVWPSDDRSPRAVARFDDGALYGALRTFGSGKVLGLASSELLSNVALGVPGNAAAVLALLGTLDRHEFAVARAEQGVAPPDNPFAGLLKIGLGPALVHAALFAPLLFFAFGVRQSAPRAEPPLARRAFAEHVQAVGGLYARRRAATHALAVYAKHVDDRVRAAMGRTGDPVDFLAARSGTAHAEVAVAYARATAVQSGAKARGDELRVLQQLGAIYERAMATR